MYNLKTKEYFGFGAMATSMLETTKPGSLIPVGISVFFCYRRSFFFVGLLSTERAFLKVRLLPSLPKGPCGIPKVSKVLFLS